MNVHLTPDLEQLVLNKVESGRFNSASEVVGEALRLLEEKDELREIELQKFRRHAKADRCDVVDGGTFIQGIIDELHELQAKQKAGCDVL